MKPRKKVFIVSGTHPDEMSFAPHVADRLERLLSDHEVVRIALPESMEERKKLSIRDGWEPFHDYSALSVYRRVLEKQGFDPSNPDHLVLDIHENPVNWEKIYPKRRFPKLDSFYQKYIKQHFQNSVSDDHYGIYFAELPDPRYYADIRSMPRRKIGSLGKRETNFLRIELPVYGVEGLEPGQVTVDKKRTKALLRASSRKKFGREAGDLIHKLLGL